MKKIFRPVALPFLLTSLLLLLINHLPAQMITTIAGGNIGDGKPATTVGTVFPAGMVTDDADNLYILDNSNGSIRKVFATTGIITTYAGNGTLSSPVDGNMAIKSGLGLPYALAIDRQGNLYFSSFARLWKIDAATGILRLVAGKGSGGSGGDGGPAIDAQLTNSNSIAVDTAGNIYVTHLQRIRRIDHATGIINTIAGTGTAGYTGDGGPAVNAQIAGPKSLTTDAAGNIYFADNNNNVIRKITVTTGIITTIAGTGALGAKGDGGPATAAQLGYSYDLKADSTGNLYLSDNNKIRKIDAATGIINTFAGTGNGGYTGDGGNAAYASFYNCQHLALHRSGNLYIHDFNNFVIRKITAATKIITTISGNHYMGTSGIGGPALEAYFYSSSGMAVDKYNNIFITDNMNSRVLRIDAKTQIVNTVAGTGISGLNHGNGGPATAANLGFPYGVVVDSIGNFYFSDDGIAVRKVTAATGIISTIAGTGTVFGYSGDGGPATAATFRKAYGLALDKAGNLYIADRDNNAVRKVTAATGIITTIAGTGTFGYSGDGGPATAAKLDSPFAVTVDRVGNVYISDNGNDVIRRIDAKTGIITTVAGTGTPGYSGDGGAATAAMLHYPYGLTTDTAGNLFIADQFNHRIRKITIGTGIITTIAGTGFTTYNGDSIPATTATVSNPVNVCFDTSGNLLIAALGNHSIRKIIYDTVPTVVTDVPSVNNAAALITKIYPNPTRGNAFIELTGNINGKLTISVTDMWGKTIQTQQYFLQQTSTYSTPLHLPGLQKGMYFVTIHVNKTRYVHSLVVQ